MMVVLMREKLHLKILFTLICIALVVGFALFQHAKTEKAFRPVIVPGTSNR
jgi:signal peptidase I